MAFNSVKLNTLMGVPDYRPFTGPGYGRLPTTAIVPGMLNHVPEDYVAYGPLDGTPEYRFSSERTAPDFMTKDSSMASLAPIHGFIDTAPQLTRVRLPQAGQLGEIIAYHVPGNQPIAGRIEQPWERAPMTGVRLDAPFRENPELRTEPLARRWHGFNWLY